MAHRTPAYVTCVILAAVILNIPQLMSGMPYLQHFRRGTPFALATFGSYSQLGHTSFWQNKFWGITHYPRTVLTECDPETGITRATSIAVAGDRPLYQFVDYGDQLWLVGNPESYRIIGGQLRKMAMTRPPQCGSASQRILLDGVPAEIIISSSGAGVGFSVTSFILNSWVTTHDIVLPDVHRSWMFGNTPVTFGSVINIECVGQKDRIHCFANNIKHLLYREGLNLRPIGNVTGEFADQPVSALEPANTEFEINGWTLVTESLSIDPQIITCGMLIEGQPAALIVDNPSVGYPTGKVYRFDGKSWSQFETVDFPFGGASFRTVCRDDGERSYILMTTATGRVYVFSASAAGVKQTFVDPHNPVDGSSLFPQLLAFPCFALFVAAIQAAITTGVMSASTRPEYGYGVQQVQLAAVTLRGVARGIDLALIAASTYIIARALTCRFDWASFGEAVTLQVSHPTISQALNLAIAIFLWLGFTILALVYVQGKWGVTPGKWCCGLRVFQTTLKPCGFLRSLTREVILAFDACNLLCWAPGIVAIALTDHRQRLGDWAADTIVIRRQRGT